GGLGERVLKHLQEDPPDVRQFNPQVSDAMWAVLLRMLAKKPEDRYQTPAELLDALKALPPQVSDGETIRLPRSKASSRSSPSLPEKSSGDSTLQFPDAPPEKVETSRPRARQVEDDPALLSLRTEHLRTAARQYHRAEEALANGNTDYAIELLLSCTKFDPV